MNTNRIKVQLTKSQFIDGRLYTVDPKGDAVQVNLLEAHAKTLVDAGWAKYVDPPPTPATPVNPPQPGEAAN